MFNRRLGLSIVMLLLTSADSIFAAPGDVLFKLTAPDGFQGGRFGEVIAAVDGDILIGESLRPVAGSGDGRAYLFDGQTGALKFQFNNPEPVNLDRFGLAVAGGDGRAYITTEGLQWRVFEFSTITGQFVRTIDDPDLNGNSFGRGLAYGGGSLLVANPSYRGMIGPENLVGRAYLFNSATGALLRAIPNPEPRPGDLFGSGGPVAVLSEKLVIGAQADDLPGDLDPDGDNPGRVWVFNRLDGSVAYTIENPNPTSPHLSHLPDSFGRAIAANDMIIAVGAQDDESDGIDGSGTVYVFDTVTGALKHTLFSPHAESNGEFGRSVAVTPEGNVLVGAFGQTSQGVDLGGHAYLFDGQTGALLLDIPAPEPSAFGWSVAAAGDRLYISGRGIGAVYVIESVPEPSALTIAASLATLVLLARRFGKVR